MGISVVYVKGFKEPMKIINSCNHKICALTKLGTVGLWDKSDLRTIALVRKEALIPNSASSIYFIFIDDSYIYLAHKGITVLDNDNLRVIKIIDAGTNTDYTYVYSDNRYLYGGTSEGLIKIWDIYDSFSKVETINEESRITVLLSDDKYLYSASMGGPINVRDINTFENIAALYGLFETFISVSVDEKYIYAGSEKGNLRIWNKGNFGEVMRIKESTEMIRADVDDKYIYIGGTKRNTVKVRNKRDFGLIARLIGHKDYISDVTADKKYIYTASADGTIIIWNKRRKPVTRLGKEAAPVYSIVSDEKKVYISVYNNISVFDKNDFGPIGMSGGHTENIFAMYVDNDYLYSGDGKGKIIIRNKENFRESARLNGHKKEIYTLIADDEYLYSGDGKGKIIVWSKDDFKKIETIYRHKSRIVALDVYGRYLYSLSDDGILKIFEKDTFTEAATLERERLYCSLCVDDRYLYVGMFGGAIRVFDNMSFENIKNLEIYKYQLPKEVRDLFSRVPPLYPLFDDGTYLYSGYGSNILVWNRNIPGKLVTALSTGGKGKIISIFGDDKYIYGGLLEGSVNIWDKKSFRRIFFGQNGLGVAPRFIKNKIKWKMETDLFIIGEIEKDAINDKDYITAVVEYGQLQPVGYSDKNGFVIDTKLTDGIGDVYRNIKGAFSGNIKRATPLTRKEKRFARDLLEEIIEFFEQT